MKNDIEISQRRARAGGELGPNGEWYEGGKFIATQEDRPKTAPAPRWEPTAAQLEERRLLAAHQTAETAKIAAWLAVRQECFAEVFRALESSFNDQWGHPLTNPDAFLLSLAKQLRERGSLSLKQAPYVVKFIHGRRKKSNAEQYDALEEALCEEYSTQP